MISAYYLGIVAWLAGAGFMAYAIFKAAAGDTPEHRSARYAAILAMVCLFVGLGFHAYADRGGVLPNPPGPSPGPEPPGPLPPGPTPPTPQPTGFPARVQAAFKQDKGPIGVADLLGAMAQRMAKGIAEEPARFDEASDILGEWETYRGYIFQPLEKWCPQTNEALASERERRGLQGGAVNDQNRVQHAQLWTEFGQALLVYE